MNILQLIVIVFFGGVSSAYAEDSEKGMVVNEVFSLAYELDGDLKELELVQLEDYDDWDRNIIIKNKYAFIEEFDLNDDGINEMFIAARSKKNNNTYLLITSRSRQVKLNKIIDFGYPRLCIKKSKDGKSLRVISKIGTELTGDVVWVEEKYQFIPYNPDY